PAAIHRRPSCVLRWKDHLRERRSQPAQRSARTSSRRIMHREDRALKVGGRTPVCAQKVASPPGGSGTRYDGSLPADAGIRFGQYVLARRIARAGMAEVILAQHRGLDGSDHWLGLK